MLFTNVKRSYDVPSPMHKIQNEQCTFLFLSDKSKSVRVGDEIKISVILKNLNGNLRTRGGDKLHVRIMNTRLDAYAPGYAIDHDNGTYTVVIPALWPGQSIISVHLAYPRELIRAFYVTKRQVRLMITTFGFLYCMESTNSRP